MVRATLASQLTSRGQRDDLGICLELATAAHDVSLRRLLRENPIPGSISVTMEREPSFFAAAALEGQKNQTIVGIVGGRVIGAGSVSARQRFVNGRPMRVGYLSALRLDASFRGQATFVRKGFELFRELHELGGPPIYLTSIIADNVAARRFLERGLSGMPTYRFLSDLVTLIVPRSSVKGFLLSFSPSHETSGENGVHFVWGTEERRAELLELLNRENRHYQFAPAWSEDEIHPTAFRMACSQDGTLLGCAASTDHRAIKQTVVRDYSKRLRWAKPFLNFGAILLGRPRLPEIGRPLSHAFFSHLAVRPDQPQLVESLIRLLRGPDNIHSVDYLTFGLDSRDPRLSHLRRAFHPREYVSRMYVVHWEDGRALAESLDGRLLAPEVATL